jgi:two-component system chemotaxis family response regulator WspR
VSIGLATATPDERISAEELLDAADRALYQAKRQGRDRVVQAPALRAALATAA